MLGLDYSTMSLFIVFFLNAPLSNISSRCPLNGRTIQASLWEHSLLPRIVPALKVAIFLFAKEQNSNISYTVIGNCYKFLYIFSFFYLL